MNPFYNPMYEQNAKVKNNTITIAIIASHAGIISVWEKREKLNYIKLVIVVCSSGNNECGIWN